MRLPPNVAIAVGTDLAGRPGRSVRDRREVDRRKRLDDAGIELPPRLGDDFRDGAVDIPGRFVGPLVD
jgi:hypothetical protein